MSSLYSKSIEQLGEELQLEKKFQAKQIYSWLIKGVYDFDKMTNIPKGLIAKLKDKYTSAISSKVVKTQVDDSATKLLIELEDGALVECVLLEDSKNRKTACLSSQVGCAMDCVFCKTGTMGLIRNLKDYEIVEQFVHLRTIKQDITHIVFMGMGEPLHNFGPLMSAISALHDENGFNISNRRITVSTSGLIPGIKKLTELNMGVRLAVSLVSANNEIRSSLMKVNNAFPLQELKTALVQFQHVYDKRITLEYCMLRDKNTSKTAARELARFTEGLFCMVNLIPWNPVDLVNEKTPTDSEIKAFTRELDNLKVNYTLRYTKGRRINGACGQLATETKKKDI